MEAFDILAEHYRPMVLAYLRILVRDWGLAEDLAQETFIAAHEKLSTFRDGGNFGAWLRGIARHKALESFRAKSRHIVIADSSILEGVEEVYSYFDAPRLNQPTWADRLELVRECVRALGASFRGAVNEVYGKGRSLSEAAAAVHISRGALAQRLSRARVLIRKCVETRLMEAGEL